MLPRHRLAHLRVGGALTACLFGDPSPLAPGLTPTSKNQAPATSAERGARPTRATAATDGVNGGRVLDLSALLASGRQDSIYVSALVWTAQEEDIVLLVPSTASGLALAQLDEVAHPVLEVLLALPVTVVDSLDAQRGREIGQLLRGRDARIDVAHAALCSLRRRWPLVTAEPQAYTALAVSLETEALP